MLKHLQDLLKEYENNNKTKIDNLKKRATFEIEFALDHIINNYIEVFDGNSFKISKCSEAMIENCKKGINFILIKADFIEIYNTFTGDFINIENGIIGIKNNDNSLSQLLIAPKFIDELKKKIDPSYIIEFVNFNDFKLLKILVPQNSTSITQPTTSIIQPNTIIQPIIPITTITQPTTTITQPSTLILQPSTPIIPQTLQNFSSSIPIFPSTLSSIYQVPTFNIK